MTEKGIKALQQEHRDWTADLRRDPRAAAASLSPAAEAAVAAIFAGWRRREPAAS